MKMFQSVLFFLLVCFMGSAAADFRAESGPNGYNNKGDNFFHVPYDNNNTDNESYISNGNLTVVISDGGDTADARGTSKQWLPEEMWPEGLTKETPLKTSCADAGEACTVEANGTTYVGIDCDAETRVVRSSVSFMLTCLDAAAQAAE